MVQHFCHSHAQCGTPQAEDSGHQSKTGQHEWWERESWKQSAPKHPPFPLPGLRAAPYPRGPSHRPHKPQYWSQVAFPASTNTWARCMIPAPAQGWQSLTTQNKSLAHSLLFIQVDADSITSLLLALPKSPTFVLSYSLVTKTP